MPTFEHLISTTAKPDSCSTCQAPIWDLWVEGVRVKVDVEPLGLSDELAARLDRRMTYQARKYEQGFRLKPRDRFNIEVGDHDRKVILALHSCQAVGMIALGHPKYFANRYQTTTQEEPQF